MTKIKKRLDPKEALQVRLLRTEIAGQEDVYALLFQYKAQIEEAIEILSWPMVPSESYHIDQLGENVDRALGILRGIK